MEALLSVKKRILPRFWIALRVLYFIGSERVTANSRDVTRIPMTPRASMFLASFFEVNFFFFAYDEFLVMKT